MGPIFALITACMLASVPVKDCNAVAQKWLPEVQRLPSSHWKLLDLLIVSDGKNSGRTTWAHDRITMTLAPGVDMRTIEHELGHVVGRGIMVNGKHLDDLYGEKFWRNGKARGKTTSYGRSTNYHEDFADCYKLTLRGGDGCDSARISFIVRYAFNGHRPSRVT